ncbi:MAG: hypothetical protein ACI4OC_03915 [Coriobacteriales bacterium]
MLTLALRDGRPVHVAEVPNGKRCGCACPQCGGAFIAYNGGKKQEHHFAHAADASRECEWATESALNLMAKEVLAEAKRMALPAVVVEADPPDIPFDVVVADAGSVYLAAVEAERLMAGFKPDLIATVRNASGRESRPMVEICVTHAVDEEKLARVAKAGVSVVEVRLGDLDHRDHQGGAHRAPHGRPIADELAVQRQGGPATLRRTTPPSAAGQPASSARAGSTTGTAPIG